MVIDGGGSPEAIALDASAGKMYWTKWNGAGKIQRSDLDGSNPETLVGTGGWHPRAIALDLEGGKIYYITNDRDWDRVNSYVILGRIGRANLDGSDAQILLTEDIPRPNVDIALDLSAGRMYWTDGVDILQADLDGTNLRGLLRINTDTVVDDTNVDIVLDVSGGRIYWSDSQGIHRADLDGSHAEPLFTGAEHPGGIAFDPVGNKMNWTEPGTEKIRRVDLGWNQCRNRGRKGTKVSWRPRSGPGRQQDVLDGPGNEQDPPGGPRRNPYRGSRRRIDSPGGDCPWTCPGERCTGRTGTRV